MGWKSMCIRFDKVNRFIRAYDGTSWIQIGDENMISSTTGLDIL